MANYAAGMGQLSYLKRIPKSLSKKFPNDLPFQINLDKFHVQFRMPCPLPKRDNPLLKVNREDFLGPQNKCIFLTPSSRLRMRIHSLFRWGRKRSCEMKRKRAQKSRVQ